MAPGPTLPQDISAIENHLRALRTPDEVIARHVTRLRELREVPATNTNNPPKRQQRSKAFSRGQIPKLWSMWR
jgi:hypothetical protein